MAMANAVNIEAKEAVRGTIAEIGQKKQQLDEKLRELEESSSSSAEDGERLRDEMRSLSREIAALEQVLIKYRSILEAAQYAYRNGSAAASITDTIARNQRDLTSNGFSAEGNNFTLAGVLFTPHPRLPASLDAIRNASAPSGDAAGTDWTASNFYVFDMSSARLAARPPAPSSGSSWLDRLLRFWEPAFAEGGKGGGAGGSGAGGAAGSDGSKVGGGGKVTVLPGSDDNLTYVFDVDLQGKVRVAVTDSSPFDALPVSEKQIMAVSLNAKTTSDGGAPVVWTAVMRNQTLYRGKARGGKHAGEPLASRDEKWCEKAQYGRQKQGGSVGSGGSPGGLGLNRTPALFGKFVPIQPAYAHGSAGGGGGGGGGQKPRKSYMCGGQAVDFQMRTPMIPSGGGFNDASGIGRLSSMTGSPAPGSPGEVTFADGTNLSIPQVNGWIITPGGGDTMPQAVMGPGADAATDLIPRVPGNLL